MNENQGAKGKKKQTLDENIMKESYKKAISQLREKVEAKQIRCPICGCTSVHLYGEDEFPFVKPSTDEDGNYLFIHGINHHVFHTMPVICEECGYLMPFLLK